MCGNCGKFMKAGLITGAWLGVTEGHLWRPTCEELIGEHSYKLKAVYLIDPDTPDYKSVDEEIIPIIQRLQKRRKIAQAIREGEDDGLYEVSEHLTSNIDL